MKGLIVDEDVAETIKDWNIHLCNGYARCFMKGRVFYLHHYICPPIKGMVTDHINRNRLDNRRENLRRVTQSENLRNTAPRKGRELKHIYKSKNGWKVEKNGVYYGYRKTYEEAILILINMTTEQKIREEFPEYDFTETQMENLVSSVEEQEEDDVFFDGDDDFFNEID